MATTLDDIDWDRSNSPIAVFVRGCIQCIPEATLRDPKRSLTELMNALMVLRFTPDTDANYYTQYRAALTERLQKERNVITHPG